MQFFAKSQNGQYVQIGKSLETAIWYTVGNDAVKAVVETLTVTDEVTYGYDLIGGKKIIGFLVKGKAQLPEPYASKINKKETEPVKTEPMVVPPKTSVMTGTWNKSNFDPEQSLKQTCMNTAGNMLSGIMTVPGMTTEKAVELVRVLFKEILTTIKQ